jgi:hypothetical protein
MIKNQVQSPIEILIQIMIFIFIGTVQLLLVLGKLSYDLYISLRLMAQTNITGLFIAIFIGGLILFVTTKFIFHEVTHGIKVMVIYIVIVAILLSLTSPGST